MFKEEYIQCTTARCIHVAWRIDLRNNFEWDLTTATLHVHRPPHAHNHNFAAKMEPQAHDPTSPWNVGHRIEVALRWMQSKQPLVSNAMMQAHKTNIYPAPETVVTPLWRRRWRIRWVRRAGGQVTTHALSRVMPLNNNETIRSMTNSNAFVSCTGMNRRKHVMKCSISKVEYCCTCKWKIACMSLIWVMWNKRTSRVKSGHANKHYMTCKVDKYLHRAGHVK